MNCRHRKHHRDTCSSHEHPGHTMIRHSCHHRQTLLSSQSHAQDTRRQRHDAKHVLPLADQRPVNDNYYYCKNHNHDNYINNNQHSTHHSLHRLSHPSNSTHHHEQHHHCRYDTANSQSPNIINTLMSSNVMNSTHTIVPHNRDACNRSRAHCRRGLNMPVTSCLLQQGIISLLVVLASLVSLPTLVTGARSPLNALMMQHQAGVPVSSFVVGSQSFNSIEQQQQPPALCPSVCSCIWSNGKPSATCEKHNLLAVPTGVPRETQVLLLNHNNFQTLPSKVFQEKGLVNLQKIFLSDCKLVNIASDAFFQLTNLIELDLSHNQLTTIPKASLKGALSLRRLSLASNPLTTIESEAFSGLQHLTSLDLSNSQLDRLEPAAFFGLPYLKDLKLTENKLTVLPPSVMADLPPFLNLELSLNPWHCDCELRVVRDWMFSNNISFSIPPACASPYKVVDLLWTSISPEKLACPPVIVSKNNDLVVPAGTNVSLTCTIKASDPMKLFWFQDEKNLTSKSNQTGARLTTSVLEERRYDMYDEHGPPGNPNVTTSVLVLFNLKPKDTSLFLCYVENEGGFTVANYSLTVLEPSASGLSFGYPSLWPVNAMSSNRATATVTGLALVVLLICCVLCLFIVKRQRHTSKETPGSPPKSHTLPPMKSPRDSLTDDDDESSSSSSSSTRKPMQISSIGMDVIEHMRKGIINMDYHSMSPVIQFNNNYNGTLRKEPVLHNEPRQHQMNTYNSDLTNSTTTTGYNSDYNSGYSDTISDQPSPNSSYTLQSVPMVTIPGPTAANLQHLLNPANGPPYYQPRSSYLDQGPSPSDLAMMKNARLMSGVEMHMSNPNFYHSGQTADPTFDYMYTLSRQHQ